MDFSKLVARIKNILLTPGTEWPVIAGEADTVSGLYTRYIALLAAIAPVFGFIKGSLIGYGFLGVGVRVPIGAGLGSAVLQYVMTLVMVYVMGLIVDALAPTFGGQKDRLQALKTVAYAYTASWVAGIGMIIPGLHWLILLAGGVYSIYLLYLGLPHTMKCPPDKAVGYTAVSILAAIVLGWVVMLVGGAVAGSMAGMGVGGYLRPGMPMGRADSGGEVTVDPDSALGKLAAMGKRAEEAGKKLEAAQQSGDADAQAKAAGAVLGAVLGGGDQVEALAPEALKPFLPEALVGLPRTGFETVRNASLGIQVSNAKASYRAAQGGAELRLEITDTGGAKGVMALAGFAGLEADKENDRGYEKTYREGGRMVHEQWDKGGSGEYTVVIGDRFIVSVHGEGLEGMGTLKAAASGLDLARLEALKGAGVKKG